MSGKASRADKVLELVIQFAEGVAAQGDSILAGGDPEVGNRSMVSAVEAWDELRSYGDEGRDALTTLFEHPRADVRVMAASYLLRYKNADAMALLRRESQCGGFAGFGASQALLRWQEGSWNLDPEDP